MGATSDYISKARVKELARRSDIWGAWLTLHLWAVAIGAMARLREHNLEPGVDVSIIGFDDVKFASCTFPKLTTVKYPIEDMGKAAACMALKEAYNTKVDVTGGVFKPSLIERDSVRRVCDT